MQRILLALGVLGACACSGKDFGTVRARAVSYDGGQSSNVVASDAVDAAPDAGVSPTLAPEPADDATVTQPPSAEAGSADAVVLIDSGVSVAIDSGSNADANGLTQSTDAADAPDFCASVPSVPLVFDCDGICGTPGPECPTDDCHWPVPGSDGYLLIAPIGHDCVFCNGEATVSMPVPAGCMRLTAEPGTHVAFTDVTSSFSTCEGVTWTEGCLDAINLQDHWIFIRPDPERPVWVHYEHSTVTACEKCQ